MISWIDVGLKSCPKKYQSKIPTPCVWLKLIRAGFCDKEAFFRYFIYVFKTFTPIHFTSHTFLQSLFPQFCRNSDSKAKYRGEHANFSFYSPILPFARQFGRNLIEKAFFFSDNFLLQKCVFCWESNSFTNFLSLTYEPVMVPTKLFFICAK